MSNKLVLVVGGDQLAVDLLTKGNPGGVLSSETNRQVQVIRIGDNAEMAQEIRNYSYGHRTGSHHEGGEYTYDWWSLPRTAEYYASRLSVYTSRVLRELPASDWEPAGIWWFFGLSDVRMFTEYRPGEEDSTSPPTIAGVQQSIEDLLLWNPFGAGFSPKSFVAVIPAFPSYAPPRPPGNWLINTTASLVDGATFRGNVNTAISGAVSGSDGVGISIAVPSAITGWDTGGLRRVGENIDYGLTEKGAAAYAEAFALATKEALGITGTHVESITVPKTEVKYTAHTQTVPRNKLSGLEGKTVTALVDGVPYTVTVSANGTLTLPQGVSGNKITVGFNYPSVLAPMPIETDSQSTGSTLGKRRAYGKCEVRVYRSKGGRYGASSTNDLYDVGAWLQSKQDPNRMLLSDIPYQLFRDDEWPYSGDVEFSMPSGQDPDSTIWIVQEEPWPLRIVSIMADVDFGQM